MERVLLNPEARVPMAGETAEPGKCLTGEVFAFIDGATRGALDGPVERKGVRTPGGKEPVNEIDVLLLTEQPVEARGGLGSSDPTGQADI